jgi:hypothetical protein
MKPDFWVKFLNEWYASRMGSTSLVQVHIYYKSYMMNHKYTGSIC